MKLDLTPLQHAGIVMVLVLAGWLFGSPWAGAALGIGIFLGREHAQAEYRWIERYGDGKRVNLPLWGGFDRRVWDLGSLLDWCVPLLVGAVLAWAVNR